MADEIEFKLVFPPQAAARVLAWPGWRAIKQGRARRRELLSIYFDTPDRRLAQAHAALRIRRDGARWIQTLKAGGGALAGLHTRSEYEWRIGGPALDAARLAALPLAGDLQKIAWRDVGPVFQTRFERTAFDVVLEGDTRAEVALDIGRIEASARHAPIHELEIELRTGQADALFALVRTLAVELPLRLEVQSKAERGEALAQRRALRPVKAQGVDIHADLGVRTAAQAILADCVAQWQANEAGFLLRADPEFLHQMRVGLRRLRVALACFRGCFAPEALEALKAELRWLGAALGPARDWDVWSTQRLPEIASSLPALQGLDELRARSRAAQRHARATARAAVRSPRYTLLLLELGCLIRALPRQSEAAATAPGTELLRDWAERLLDKRHAKVRDPAVVDSSALHELRIAAKRLRYAAEFFVSLGRRKRAARYVRGLARLQSVLGAINDAAIGRGLLHRLAAAEWTAPGAPAVPATTVAAIDGWLAGQTLARGETLAQAWRDWHDCPKFW